MVMLLFLGNITKCRAKDLYVEQKKKSFQLDDLNAMIS